MKKSARIVLFSLLAALCAGRAAAITVGWTGAGRTPNASDGANWTAGRAPGEGDNVLFGIFSSRDCYWDLDTRVESFVMNPAFRGDVRIWAPLRVAGEVRVEGGMLYLSEGSLTAGSRLYIGRKGLFELAEGVLEAGPGGIVVDEGGTFFSRGDAKASIRPAVPGSHYDFVVAKGTLVISNPAGTELSGSSGITLHSGAKLKRADFVEVRDLKPGAAAVRLFGPSRKRLQQDSWKFDGSVGTRALAPDPDRESAELARLKEELARTPPPADLPDRPAPAAPAEETQDPPFAGLEEYEAQLAKAQYVPYLSLQFAGGQYFFGGERGGLSGNLNALGSVSIKHEKLGGWTLVPLLSSQYQGTKQVTDLVGGGTLFQERMSHTLAVRGVYQLTPEWKLKPSIGYKWEFLKETRDESWGDGLFDYRRPGFGVEGEYTYADPFTLRAGYDFYHIGFVNYRSLESIIQDSQGNSLARELAGDSVLDSYNHSLYGGGTLEGPWRSYLDGTLATTFRFFPEQHVVDGAGQLRNSTRRDMSTQLAAAWRFPREFSQAWKGSSGFRLAAGYNLSNQNSYDAQRLKYLKGYYDSSTVRAGADLDLYHKLGEGRRLGLNFSATLGRTDYYGRRTQDPSGLYLGGRVYQYEAMANAGVSYPVAPHFVWTAQFGYGRQTSNQRFERLYKYNLTTTTYRIGFGYEY